MPEMEINGYRYIGFLSIPDLKLELPIMSTWNYRKLKIADRESRENRECGFRSDPRNRSHLDEHITLFRREEAKKDLIIFTHGVIRKKLHFFT